MNFTNYKSIVFFVMMTVASLYSQEGKKGSFYAHWGWHESNYSKSDITFTGKNYNFKLKDVTARDKQTPFSAKKYLNPANISIPQTNYGIGYFFHDNWSVYIGVDHMKYVMNNNKTVAIDGEIGEVDNPLYANFSEDQVNLTEDFLLFEHTDGLNYAYVAINRFDNIGKYIGLKNVKNVQLDVTEGLGFGLLIPKTNATLGFANKERYDDFHVSGFGISALAGLNLTLWKYFFVQTDLRAGYINMSDIRTTQSTEDKASQTFWFLQRTLQVGARFRLF